MDHLEEQLKNMTPLARAVFALKETRARLDALQRSRTEPIAIVGMACRFPGGATDPASFWRLICDRVDAIREVPPDRWDVDAFYDPDPAAPGKMNSRCGGFVDRIDEFDNHFFGISDREATRMDPQHRMLLELAWEALEDGGLPPQRLRGSKTGVFLGIAVSEYGMMLANDVSHTDAAAAIGASLCLAANRLSFVFGLEGPSIVLDTACSSSLVAIHLACQSIRNGECETALAGGSSMLLSPIASINLTKAGFCSSDGRVRAFDAAASGYVRGEGTGLVVLKPLSAAVKNEDPIYAVIRGSAVNQNGSSNGLTAPSRAAQEQVLRDAYARARVSPGRVGFVETQGTGTPLGDAIEALALGNVLGEGRSPESPCAIGSVKTNIGHLEAASGTASLMKAVLALEHRQLPPNLHFHRPNPGIPFADLPLRVQERLEPWPDAAEPRVAGVSAFGFGGSNAHVVLEEWPAVATTMDGGQGMGEGKDEKTISAHQPRSTTAASHTEEECTTSSGRYLLPLSARTERALDALAQRYGEFLRSDPPGWCDVCHTAAQRRDHHDCRVAVLAESHRQAADLLDVFYGGRTGAGVFAGRKPYGRALKIAFLFAGSAEVWKPYCRHLAHGAPGFDAALAEMDTTVQRVCGWPLESVLADETRWDDPAYAQPALVAFQLALASWWHGGGICPSVVLGQGGGEPAAASAAGILTAEEALRIAAAVGERCDLTSLDGRQYRRASLPFLSALDGKTHSGQDLNAAHWCSAAECCEGLVGAVAALGDRHVDICLEVGPAALLESVRCPAGDRTWLAVPSLRRTDGGDVDVLTAVGNLYTAGADVLWQRLAPTGGRCVRVPTYPWQRQSLWLEGKNGRAVIPAAMVHADKAKLESTTSVSAAQLGHAAVERGNGQIHSRPDLTSPYVAPRTDLEKEIAEAWSAILRIDRVGVHDNFFELGGDSLQATVLLNQLQEQLGEVVLAHVLFQVQTIHDLADYLRQHCPDAVLRRYPQELTAESGEPNAAGLAPRAARPPGAELQEVSEVPAIPRLGRASGAEQLLARLDELSDDEVQSLLESRTASRGGDQ